MPAALQGYNGIKPGPRIHQGIRSCIRHNNIITESDGFSSGVEQLYGQSSIGFCNIVLVYA